MKTKHIILWCFLGPFLLLGYISLGYILFNSLVHSFNYMAYGNYYGLFDCLADSVKLFLSLAFVGIPAYLIYNKIKLFFVK